MELLFPTGIVHLFAVPITVALYGFVSMTRNFKPLGRWRYLSHGITFVILIWDPSTCFFLLGGFNISFW